MVIRQRLKAQLPTRDVPVIFLSALGEADDKVRAFAVGGVDYVTKPFEPREVLARVQTHLTLRSLTRKLETANGELAEQLAELEARNEELDAFAHTVAHDIKSPMAVISGYADLLLRPSMNYRRMAGMLADIAGGKIVNIGRASCCYRAKLTCWPREMNTRERGLFARQDRGDASDAEYSTIGLQPCYAPW
jgi:signal transduction histidine kinase